MGRQGRDGPQIARNAKLCLIIAWESANWCKVGVCKTALTLLKSVTYSFFSVCVFGGAV